MSLRHAAAEVANLLQDQGVPYVVISGLALQHWGSPRLTHDMDVMVVLSEEALNEFVHAAAERFRPGMAEAEDVEGIGVRQRRRLDLSWVRRCLVEFRQVIDEHDPVQVFEGAVRKADQLVNERRGP